MVQLLPIKLLGANIGCAAEDITVVINADFVCAADFWKPDCQVDMVRFVVMGAVNLEIEV